ncbi:hypothetical protein EHQ92_15240 [Leptospira biflexa]|uniref:hypothetical protein n=1 Tax=Leptospira biflexa TaxID=172 RepID=UPI001090B906|nr:hypothetical protein [Leptospira biflexa]TGM42691.1 hypothetical protein EHQ92_15240 [Leptospira biflexa]TGM45769.1 hypothetical protein EHQ88_12960 [Leptospira biflexa]
MSHSIHQGGPRPESGGGGGLVGFADFSPNTNEQSRQPALILVKKLQTKVHLYDKSNQPLEWFQSILATNSVGIIFITLGSAESLSD